MRIPLAGHLDRYHFSFSEVTGSSYLNMPFPTLESKLDSTLRLECVRGSQHIRNSFINSIQEYITKVRP